MFTLTALPMSKTKEVKYAFHYAFFKKLMKVEYETELFNTVKARPYFRFIFE